MQIFTIKCEILTPIHIGGGEELEPYDYLIKNNQFYKINLADYQMNLNDEDQKVFYSLLSNDLIKLRQFTKENVDTSRFSEYSTDVSDAVLELYNTRIDVPENRLMIAPFIKELNRSYLPGSSIKGAFRTAFIYSLFNGKFEGRENRSDIFEAELLKSQRGFFDSRAQQWITKGLDQAKDPFRAIKISDVYLPEHSTIIEKIDTITKKGIEFSNLNMQIVKEVTHSSFAGKSISLIIELRFDDQLLNRNKDIKQTINHNLLIRACNTHRKDMIKNELTYFNKNHPAYEIYNQLSNVKLHENECLLRIGWGCGFNSITVNMKREKRKDVKTRKLINNYLPLGWVKLNFQEQK